MNWNRDQVVKAVEAVLREGKWPVYRSEDDRGLDKYEYVEFVADVLNKMAIQKLS